MNSDKRVKELFLAALEKETPADRDAYLKEACGDDEPLRRQVDELLRKHEEAGSFLEQPTRSTAVEAQTPREGVGAVLADRYQLLEQIGEGGMGSVWMARQNEPVKRLVAVKLIKPGIDARDPKHVLARFDAERQAYALMDHPNIAKVYDAGATPDGRPFFVMELVKGIPITRFCDERRLNLRQRVELLIPVCQAIQHAHQKGVVHRDIKPSNILVALYDDRPVPKVIDFGVAKATGQPLTEQTLHTGFGAVIGTLEYMSPEQAGFNQLDVDTRSDIYSLGVLLFELLVGSPPISRKEFETIGLLEMLRVIREREPAKPSAKLSSSEQLPTLAANRGMEPKRITALIKGDLDWIVMKALEKDRTRRYETANGFASDLQRFLADEPVDAGPPSSAYRFRKFVRRHRGQVTAAAVLLAALVAGIVGTSLGMAEARRQRDEADRQAELARRQADIARKSLESLYTVASTQDPIEQFFPGQLRLDRRKGDESRMSLSQVRRDMAQVLVDRPRERARLEMVVGNVFRSRGDWREAMDLLQSAVRTLSEHPNASPDDGAEALYYLGWVQRDIGDLDDAERSFRACLNLVAAMPDRLSRQMQADVHLQLGWTLSDRGIVSTKWGIYRSEATASLKTAAMLYNDPSIQGSEVKVALCQLMMLLINFQGKATELLQLGSLLQNLPIRDDALRSVLTYAEAERARRKGDAAEYRRHSLILDGAARRLLGTDHPVRAHAAAYAATAYRDTGEIATAEQMFREVVDIGRKRSPHHPLLVGPLLKVSDSILDRGGDPAEALKSIVEAEQIAKLQPEDVRSRILPPVAAARQRAENAMVKPSKK